MKKRKKLWIILLLLLLILLAGLALWQRENLRILIQAGKYTTEDLNTKLAENRQTLQTTLEQHPEISARAPTEEETQALKTGELAPEELIKALVETAEPQVEGGGAAEPDQTGEIAQAENPYSAELSELIARVLALQALYVGKLESLEVEAKAEYRTKPESERTKTKLVEWASGYVKRATEMEKECDAEIDGIVREMLALIRKYGGDTEIPDTVVFCYAEEKRLKKAWYISRLEEGGLL